MDNQLFLGRKNEVVSKLDNALKAFATTFGIKMNLSLLHRDDFVSMLMVKAVQARFSRIDEATCQLVVFSAVMELDIPADGDEQHHKCHQTRSDLQQPLFHGAKIQKNIVRKPRFDDNPFRAFFVHSLNLNPSTSLTLPSGWVQTGMKAKLQRKPL